MEDCSMPSVQQSGSVTCNVVHSIIYTVASTVQYNIVQLSMVQYSTVKYCTAQYNTDRTSTQYRKCTLYIVIYITIHINTYCTHVQDNTVVCSRVQFTVQWSSCIQYSTCNTVYIVQ